MTFKKVSRLDEGPLDFARGFGREGVRQVKNSGIGRAVGNMVQAGRDASAEADAKAVQTQLIQSVQQLGQLVAKYNQLTGQVPDEVPQGDDLPDNPRPADNGQQPHQQQKDNVKMGVPDAFRTTQKPKGRIGQHGFEYTFDSYLRQVYGTEEQLDEGFWDFLKGAGKEGARAGVEKIKTALNPEKSTLAKMYRAGRQASHDGNVRNIQAKMQQVAAQIAALAEKVPQKEAAIRSAIAQVPQPLQRATMYFIRQAIESNGRQDPTV